MHAALALKDLETVVAQRAVEHGGGRLDEHQLPFGLFLVGRRADCADHLVDIGQGQQQALDRVLSLPGLRQKEERAAADDDLAVADELFQQLLERQHARLAVHQCQEDQRKRVLQRRELIHLSEHDVRIGVALQFVDQADRLFQVALVPRGRDAGDPPVFDDLRDPLFDAVAGGLVGHLVDHDAHAAFAVLFDAGLGADRDRAAARVIAPPQPGAANHDIPRGEVRSRHDFHQLVDGDVRIVDGSDQGVADFSQVVRRDRRGHADRDALRAVDQQVRKLRRQHGRLRALLVVGGQVIDRVHLHVVQHQRRDGRHAGLGVPHGGGGQPGDGAEIALLVDERVAGVPVLGQPHERGIDRHVAVRVIALHRLADNARALRRGGARREAQVGHGDEDAALRGLETVADIGQGAADDDAHRVGQVAVL